MRHSLAGIHFFTVDIAGPVSRVTGFVLPMCQRSACRNSEPARGYSRSSPHFTMNHALVLACGNPLRGDDGVAVLLARYFRAEFCEPETDIQSLAAVDSRSWRSRSASPTSFFSSMLPLHCAPGKVQLKRIEPAREFSSNLTHTMGPEALLALAVQLYSRKPERAFLLTIGGASFDHADYSLNRYARQFPLPWI